MAGGTGYAFVPLVAGPRGARWRRDPRRRSGLPLLAFAHAPDPGGDEALPFVDRPDLAAAVAEASELHVVTTAELATPVSAVDLTALAEDERRQIASWNPPTVGHVLFNFWD